MWSHVYEQMLLTGKSSHQATVAAQALMHELTKAAPQLAGGPHHDQPEWLRRT
jgi:hypothetical protein